MNPKTLVKIWRPKENHPSLAEDDHNFGDFLGLKILEWMNVDFEEYSVVRAAGRLDQYDRVLHPIGTVIGNWGDIEPRFIRDYWGCGWNGRRGFIASDHPNSRFHSVRGIQTRLCLGLPQMPTGDTGFLASRFLNVEKTGDEGVLWCSHIVSRSAASEAFLDDIMADNVISVVIKSHEFDALVQRLRNAKIVITSAMHIAILCMCLGVPFAFSWPPGAEVEFPFKYMELCESVGIPFVIVKDIKGAWKFHERYGSRIKLPDLDAMLAAYPYSNES